MTPIRVAFKREPTTMFGWLVKLCTRAPVHCEIVWPDQTILAATEGIGVYERHWNDLADEHANWVQVPIPGTECLDWQAIRSAMRTEVGARYDLMGALFGWWWGRQSAERWFCSELCAHVAARAGYALHRRRPGRYTPARLFRELTA